MGIYYTSREQNYVCNFSEQAPIIPRTPKKLKTLIYKCKMFNIVTKQNGGFMERTTTKHMLAKIALVESNSIKTRP